ncbi:uncharacterized protein LOC117557974 [Gymnodraco acuticeps]|uniref:ribonuclease H n=1 Tax=Gymnodraco acuticeps TaxID=8218 RepID=A0A6P8VH79_GYMAC|nr:uncharacterized protein LOC117557974 [Gymnodraco acuticeps]
MVQNPTFEDKELLNVCQWLLAYSDSQELLRLTHQRVFPPAVFMETSHLHCTANIVDDTCQYYDESFVLEDLNDEIRLKTMYWNSLRAAISVRLGAAHTKLYQIPGAVPHISLARGPTDKWRDLGPIVKEWESGTDWICTDDPWIEYSPKHDVFKYSIDWSVHVLRSLTLTGNEDYVNPVTGPEFSFFSHISELFDALKTVPQILWAAHKYDVGLIRSAELVVITPKSTFRPNQPQYPLKREAVDGIRPVFTSLLKQGVIIPCNDSPVRTPVFPVKKIRDKPPDEWRFVQDLRAVNAAVHARAPLVPNPYLIISQVPASAAFFTVIDLSNAFFSVPVHKDSQFWFAFEFDGKPYTFTRLCQGYCESPTVYNQALCTSLASLQVSKGTALIQYVDDIMICAPTAEQCEADSIALLMHLAAEGHKASLSKLQYVQRTVTFLGHIISGEGKTLSDKRIASLASLPKPVTKRQMMSFLGFCSYCRSFIPNYSPIELPLRTITYVTCLKPTDHLIWTPEADKAFINMKLALQSPPTLSLPDHTKPFTQAVDERNGCMTSVLLQDHGGKQRPVGYFSSKLDPVAAGLPKCLRAVAAAEKALNSSRDIVGYTPLTLLVPHAVSLILLEQRTSHLSAARYLRYHTCLLDMPNVYVKRCNTLNPASLMPLPEDGDEHDCVAKLSIVCTPRPDLKDVPLTNADLILYVDGSACRDQGGTNRVGFSVVSDSAVLRSGPLPCHLLSQAAELIALTEACTLAKGKTVTIYTDSRYAFGVVHDFGAIWKCRQFLKSDGKPVLNHVLVAGLLDAILLPSEVAVCKCAAHASSTDPVSLGNPSADSAAKAAALIPLTPHAHSFF